MTECTPTPLPCSGAKRRTTQADFSGGLLTSDAGALQPSEQVILVDTFPARKRGMAMAVFTMAILVAPILGPTLGGWLTDNYGWQSIFYMVHPGEAYIGLEETRTCWFLLEL